MSWYKKPSNVTRFIYGNIGTLPRAYGEGEYKMDECTDAIGDGNAVFYCEINRSDDKQVVQDANKIYRASKKPWTYTHNINNKNINRDKYNYPGGVAMTLDNDLSKYIYAKGFDKRALGRWQWVTIQGKETYTTFINIYRATSSQATYEYQLARIRDDWTNAKNASSLTDLNGSDDLMDLWDADLQELLEDKMSIGSVIIGGDFNDNLHDSNCRTQKFMTGLGLDDAFSRYQSLPPHTFQGGSNRRVDGIFTNIDIIGAGYLSFDNSPADHMWMFLDINWSDITGHHNINPIRGAVTHKATSKIPSVQEAFNKLLEEQVRTHRLDDKLAILQHDIKQGEHNIGKALDSIARQAFDIVAHADKKCRKVVQGSIPFSPKLKKARQRIKMFKLIRARIIQRNKRPKLRRIQRLANSIGYQGNIKDTDLSNVLSLLQKAKESYKSIKPNAPELRKKFLTNLAREKSAREGGDEVKHLKVILHQERQKSMHRKNKAAVGKIRGASLIAVEREENGNRTRIVDKSEIEDAIIQAHEEKMMAANYSPLRQLPFNSLLGEHGDFGLWKKVFQGQIKIPFQIERPVQLWYERITSQMPLQDNNSQNNRIEWTPKEYFEGWRKMKEGTGSGPGPSFPHMKCIEAESRAGFLFSNLALLPIQTGIVPSPWLEAIETCIPKKTTDLRPSKLRRITLFTSQLNHNKKIIGKKMMENGEANAFLAPEQYGSRKQKSASQHAANKKLVLDLMRIQKLTGIYVANDAKGCYDRILFVVAYLTMRHMGIPHDACVFSISCLMNMKYYVRTGYGKSTNSYGGDDTLNKWGYRLHGIGQGSGDGPALWAGISSPLFDILRDQGFGFNLMSSITGHNLKLAGFGFVDDTDYLQILTPTQSKEQLLPLATQGLSLWEGLIRTTGGAIEPSKSDWVWIEQQWNPTNGRWMYCPKDDSRRLAVRDTIGEITPLLQFSCHESRETLGIKQSPDGSEFGQIDHMKNKAKRWCSRLAVGGLSHMQTRHAFFTTLHATLSYPLQVTTLNKKECKDVQNTYMPKLLPRCGIIRTAAKEIVYGPTNLGGLGFPDLHIQQLSSHINSLIQYGSSASITGQLIRSVIEATTLELGIGIDIFKCITKDHPWVSWTWIWRTIRDLQMYNISVQYPFPNLTLHRQSDKYIMQELKRKHGNKLDHTEWRKINRVRMFLRVTTISDISKSCGTQLQPNILTATTTPSCSGNLYHWGPLLDAPHRSDIALWERIVRQTFTDGTSTRLLPPLCMGAWFRSALSLYPWLRTTDGNLQVNNNSSIRIYTPIAANRARRRKAFRPLPRHPTTTALPTGSPVDVDHEENGNIFVVNNPISQVNILDNSNNNEYITPWPLAQKFGDQTTEQHLCSEIQLGTAKLVTDGSFKYLQSSSAYMTIDAKWGGGNIVPGSITDQSAYRGECGGFLGLLMRINSICNNNNITSGSCQVGIDCQGAIDSIQKLKYLEDVPALSRCQDILHLIKYHMHKSPITWEFIKVKAHQDQSKAWNDLNEWEQANSHVDLLAKGYLEDWYKEGRPPINDKVEGSRWQFFLEGNNISNDHRPQILHHTWGKKLKSHWIKRLKCHNAGQINESSIDWISFQYMMKTSESHVTQFRTKHMAHISATGVNMVRRRERTHDTCPRCGSKEDNFHISTKCTGEEVQEEVDDLLPDIESFILQKNLRVFATYIIDSIKCYRNDEEVQLPEETSVWYTPLSHQLALGPHSVTWGMFHTSIHTVIINEGME